MPHAREPVGSLGNVQTFVAQSTLERLDQPTFHGCARADQVERTACRSAMPTRPALARQEILRWIACIRLTTGGIAHTFEESVREGLDYLTCDRPHDLVSTIEMNCIAICFQLRYQGELASLFADAESGPRKATPGCLAIVNAYVTTV